MTGVTEGAAPTGGRLRDGNHYRAVVVIGSGGDRRQKEKAFHQGDAEPFADMIRRAQIWQDETRLALRKEAPAIRRGSLRAALDPFFDTVPAAQRDRVARELRPWLDGARSIRRPRGAAPLVTSRAATSNDWTCCGNGHGGRMRAWLRARLTSTSAHSGTLIRTLDGDDAPNPAAFMKKLPEPKALARAIDPALLDAILASMPDVGYVGPRRRGPRVTRPTVNKSKIRLQVVAAVGMPQKQIMLLTPTDLDLDGRRTDVHLPGPHVYSHAREKGDGTPGAWLPLTAKGVTALRAFHAGDCYGRFSTSAVAKAFRRAIDRFATQLPDEAAREVYRNALPPGVRPYDGRHSFATALLKACKDHQAVGFLLQHAPGSKITERYTVGAHADVMSAAIAQLDAQQTAPPPAAAMTKPKTRARGHLRAVAGGKR